MGAFDANTDLSFISRPTETGSEYAMGEHLPHHWHIAVTVDDGNNLRHPGALARFARLQRRTGKRLVDIACDGLCLIEHEVAMHERRDPPEGMQVEVTLRHICRE